MSYYSDSDRSSGSGGGGAAGAAGIVGTILLVCVVVGLKVTARTAGRALSRHSFNSYDNRYEPPPGDPNFYSREGARQTSIVRSGVPADEGERLAREQAERERREREQAELNAQRQAEWQRQEAARQQEAEQKRLQREEELAAFNRRRDEQAAQRQAEAEQREREAALRRQAANPPAGQQNSIANPEVPPGFPVTAVDQVKPRDVVFAQSEKGWFLALVQWRRGAMAQVRFVDGDENGRVGQFSLLRIRLQTDPGVAAAESPSRPEALRPVLARDPANQQEPEDDALVVARPRAEVAAENPPAPPAPASTTPASAQPMFRQWTNDTGEFKVEAECLTCEFDLVQLKKRDGKIISIRIEKLSAADQAHIRAQFP
jgi:cell division protein FtsN